MVYSGASRVPLPIFNEKVLAGLGADLQKTGAIGSSAAKKALAALRRFKLLVDHIDARRVQLIATAAVRDATNGADFVRAVKALKLPCRVLDPEEEASLAGLGVISAIPWADGIVGDLGGGSLELVEVSGGKPSKPISLPIGVLRSGDSRKEIGRLIRDGVAEAGLSCEGRRPFYMVGGSWRALARIDMLASDYPLPVLHQYRMMPERAAELCELVAAPERWAGRLAPARLASSPVASAILAALVEELAPSLLTVSSFGIREGLLYSELPASTRRLDPLVAAARALNESEGRSATTGERLDEWLAGAFDDRPERSRIRKTACLLADVARRANPTFRSERAIEMALHGNWVGIDAAGRVLLAQCLSCAFDNDDLADTKLLQLCRAEDVQRSKEWGLAIRIGQRLSGGIASVLEETRLLASDGDLVLKIPKGQSALVNDAVRRRLARLAEATGKTPLIQPF